MKVILSFLFLISTFGVMAQNTEFDKMLKDLYEYSIPLVKSAQVKEWMKGEKIYLLDARETKEYQVSHIDNAINVGYDDFKISSVKEVPKDAKVIVYCSVGYRSERIGENLIKDGYSNVFNLYGGIFDWVNDGNVVYDSTGKVTKVHAYNKDWGKWVENEKVEKVY